MGRYRFIVALTLLLWLLGTLLLAYQLGMLQLPLLSIRFSSELALVWVVTGAALLLLLLYSLVYRPGRGKWVRYFENISTYLSEAVAICTPKGRVRWCNEAALDLFTDGKIIPQNVQLLIDRAFSSGRVALQTLTFREGVRFSVQVLPLDAQNLAIVCRPLQAESGHNTFYENFIRRIVHDMRNPLAAIIGHSANIRQSANGDVEGWRKSAATIEGEAQRLSRLVDSMLFDARLAYVPLSLNVLDLVDLLEEALYSHDEQAAQDGKTLEMETPPGAVRIEGDHDLLVRAFANLIDNGLKYSGEGGRLRIHLAELPNAYVVHVSDDGDGIPPEYLPDRIFEPLVRARPHGSGSGLGLSIARKIFEMHGGTITAQSKVGEGTVMTVRLPKPSGEPTS